MARKVSITWPLLDTAAICALQTTAGAASLLMNGTQSQAVNPNSSTKIFKNFQLARTVSLTSTANLSGVNFTITGTDILGNAQSETRAGPNINTVYTTDLFATVTSVTVNGAVGTNVSVGTGTSGHLAWVKLNKNSINFSATVEVIVVGTINYTFVTTLDNPESNTLGISEPISTMISQTASITSPIGTYELAYSGAGAPTYSAPVFAPSPFEYCSLLINSSDNTGDLVFSITQQGIT